MDNKFFNSRKPIKYSYFHAVEIIIAVNVLCFFIKKFYAHFNLYFSLNTINITEFHMYWQFVTYMFNHADISHLLSNMLGLLFFGLSLERALGSWEFLIFYFSMGILCGVASFLVYLFLGQNYVYLMGASGAIYAVLLMFAVAFPRAKIYIWGILPLPAPLLVIIYAAIEIYSQIFSKSSNVAHLTHLFGFAFACLYCLIRFGETPWRIWKRNYRS